jgi:hypothetical protein
VSTQRGFLAVAPAASQLISFLRPQTLPLPQLAASQILPLPWPLGYPCVPAVCSPSSSSAACEGHVRSLLPSTTALANRPRRLPGMETPVSPPGLATLDGWKQGLCLQGSAATSRPRVMGPRLRQHCQEAAPWWAPLRRLVVVAAGLLLHCTRVRRGAPDDARSTCHHLVRTQHGVTASAGQRRGDVEVRSYLRDQAGSRSLVFDLSITHDRFGSSSHVQQNGSLSHPQDLDGPMRVAAQRKTNAYKQTYADNQNISFLPAIMSTSNRMHGEFLRLLFLQAHRETEAHFTAAGMPSQRNQSESFRFKRAAFYQGLKSKVGLAAAKAAALRINLNVQGCSIVAAPMHAPSRTSLLLPLLLSHNLPLPRVH